MSNPQLEDKYKKLRKEFRVGFASLSEQREEVFKRDNYLCVYCGCRVITLSDLFKLVDKKQRDAMENTNLTDEQYQEYNPRKEIEESDEYRQKMATLDHKTPLTKGGDNSKENLVTCCKSCNSKKRDNIQLENGYTKIANGLLEKFAQVKMSGTCWQVLMAILRKLYGHNKKEDWIEYSQLMKLTDLPKSRISFSVKQLSKYGIVTQKRNGIKQILSINKDFNRIVTQKQNSYINIEQLHKHVKNTTNRSMFMQQTVPQTSTTKETNTKETNTKEIGEETSPNQINQVLDLFYKINPALNFGNTTERNAVQWVVDKWGIENSLRMVEYTISIQGQPFAPVVTSPSEFKKKIARIKIFKDTQLNQKNHQKGGITILQV